MAKAFPAMTPQRRQNIAAVMLQYLSNSPAIVNRPGSVEVLLFKLILNCVTETL